jgi:hypothetical protein
VRLPLAPFGYPVYGLAVAADSCHSGT